MNDIKGICYILRFKTQIKSIFDEYRVKTQDITEYLNEWQILTSECNYTNESNEIFWMFWCQYKHGFIKDIGERWWINEHGDRTDLDLKTALEVSNHTFLLFKIKIK